MVGVLVVVDYRMALEGGVVGEVRVEAIYEACRGVVVASLS